MAKTITGTFKYPDNTPVANGVLKLRLSQAANISGTALFVPSEIIINLDVNGSIPAATQIICNDELTPSGTTYYAAVYSANIVNGVTLISGQVFSQQWSITGTSPIDLTSLTPSSQGVSLVVPISSVSLTMPSEFSVSGSPVTASGGFTVTKATQAANLVYAGPSSGPAAQPTFRSLVDADVAGVVNLRTNLAIPAGPDTIVARSTTDTIKNKTLTGVSSGNAVTLLNQQPAAGAITGNAADQTLFTFTIPGNTVGAGKGVRATFYIQHTTGTASVTYKVKLGATTLYSGGSASVNIGKLVLELFNNAGVQNAQSWGASLNFDTTFVNNQTGTAAVDMTVNEALVITFNVANTDAVTPKFALYELIQ